MIQSAIVGQVTVSENAGVNKGRFDIFVIPFGKKQNVPYNALILLNEVEDFVW